MPAIKLVCFDVDGVLRDSAKFYYMAHIAAFDVVGLGKEFENGIGVEDLWHFKGLAMFNFRKNTLNALYTLLKDGKISRIPELTYLPDAEKRFGELLNGCPSRASEDEMSRMIDAYLKVVDGARPGAESAPVYPGVVESLEKIKKSGKRIAIFTNASRASVEMDLAKIVGEFEFVISSRDLGKPKPSGIGIVHASQKSGVDLKEIAYVGDTVVDVRAAKDAGCISICITSGMGLEQHMVQESPDHIAKSLKDAADWIIKN